MRIILYSDLQLHPWKEFAQTVDGVNDRILDHIAVLEQILEYAKQNNIQYIFFGGDMFEARAKVDVVAAKLLAEWKWKVSSAHIRQVDVIGNHDCVDKSTYHNAIDLYKNIPGQTIITTPCWYSLPDGNTLLLVPYQHKLEDMQAAMQLKVPDQFKPSIGIVHYGLYETPMESHAVIRDLGYDTEGQMRLSDLEPALSHVKKMFFGHFHVTTQVTDKVHFIGTPLQHKWGERSVETRFLDINLDTGEFKGIPTVAPKFIEFETLADMEKGKERIKGNFCRVKVDELGQKEMAVQKLLACEARGADAIVVKKVQQAHSRLGLNLSMSFEEMGTRLVDADYETKLDREQLKSTLYEILKEAAAKRAG